MEQTLPKNQTTLYVDLDGTFIKSDMLIESFFAALKANPLVILLVFIWLAKGRAFLKMRLSEQANIDVKSIPLNLETYDFLEQQKALGRKIILATASTEKIAKEFVSNYPLFNGYIASNKDQNLKGKYKLHKIQKSTHTFSYMGNSIEDFELFEHASESYLVAPTSAAKRKKNDFTETFDISEGNTLKLLFKQLRIYQWVKNLLIFVPLFVSGLYFDVPIVLSCVVAFFAFSFLASATYVVNDIVDLESDRQHHRKKNRPLASGELSIVRGVFAAIILSLASLIMAISLSFEFFFVLILYLCLTLSYSFKIKRYFAMDVIALSSLYTIRIFAGSAVLKIDISFWLLSFSMFVFLSLALVKRCAELVALKKQKLAQVAGRDYGIDDLIIFTSFGTSSALLSILMYCFYLNNDNLTSAFQKPNILWLSLPALGYWLMRIWVKTLRGEMHDDPIVYSLKDKGSIVSIGFMCIITLIAQIL